MKMSGRLLKGDRFVIHPKIPAIAKLFVKVPDTRIWLTNPPPAGFLRWEGPSLNPVIQLFASISFPVKKMDWQHRRERTVVARNLRAVPDTARFRGNRLRQNGT